MSSPLSVDKLAFVGFKGSFRPDWVHLEVDSDRVKIHQVLPVPVVHKMKLWVAGRVGRAAQRLWSPPYTTPTQKKERKEKKLVQTHTYTHTHIHTASTTESLLQAADPRSSGVCFVFFVFFSKIWREKCDSVCLRNREKPNPGLALPVTNHAILQGWRGLAGGPQLSERPVNAVCSTITSLSSSSCLHHVCMPGEPVCAV